VSNGGAVFSSGGYMGEGPTYNNNNVLITGTGSVWSNKFFLVVGNLSSSNQLNIDNGGALISVNGEIGVSASFGDFASNNTVIVHGPSST